MISILGLILLLLGYTSAQSIFWSTRKSTPVVTFQSTMIVPPLPAENWKTLFLWPGISPWNMLGEQGKNYLPIDNGVLQPVLTFGDSCAPKTGPLKNIDRYHAGWWISGKKFTIIFINFV
jgi:hypothetical protein